MTEKEVRRYWRERAWRKYSKIFEYYLHKTCVEGKGELGRRGGEY